MLINDEKLSKSLQIPIKRSTNGGSGKLSALSAADMFLYNDYRQEISTLDKDFNIYPFEFFHYFVLLINR